MSNLLNSGLSAFTAQTSAGATTDAAKINAKTAQANAAAAQSNSTKIIALVGAGLVALVVIVLVLRRK